MTAEAIAKGLGGRKVGTAWMARCPAHDDRTPSLAIANGRDGKLLVRCHAGCDQRDVIAALRARGAWPNTDQGAGRLVRRAKRQPPAEPDRDAPGEAAAQECAWRWKREGRRVRIARPPQGMDFNDLLARRVAHIEEAVR